ncbi:CDP-alcohol phosphatidyltransferase family protein [Candidatus Saccharibacteria bacterium]|nr:CDP-alcohol phosphatidyltransferase family protein [Candidatus Saccharibacteria bacterium]
MQDPTEMIGNSIKVLMAHLAHWLNNLFDRKLRPAHITTLSLLGHIPAAWALWQGRPVLASIYIVIFGLMDSLDGALAREQKSVSKLGMFFDATTDRLKEVIVYSALAVYVSKEYATEIALWVVPAVVGTSLLVSYVKAKGEMAISANSHDKQLLNRAFSQGIARYEIRMTILIIGLVSGLLPALLNLIIALNLITAAMRFIEISRLLNIEDHQPATKKHAKS